MANRQLDLADLPALGADVVVHSATRFLNGHSDVIAGVMAGNHDHVREVQRRVITLGTCLDPHAAYLVWRGLQTFELRLRRELAAALAEREDVFRVRYPSLPGVRAGGGRGACSPPCRRPAPLPGDGVVHRGRWRRVRASATG